MNLNKAILHRPGNVLIGLLFGFFLCARLPAEEWPTTNIDPDTILGLKSKIGYVGSVVAARKWTDLQGIHYLLITENTIGAFCEPGFRSELYGYLFLVEGEGFRMVWEIRDFGENECSRVQLLEGSIDLRDIDNDSIAESSFMYEIGHDCCDPLTVKLMLHTKGKKLAIRGKIPMEEGTGRYEKSFDEAFLSFPSLFREHAARKWREHIEKHYSIRDTTELKKDKIPK